MTFPDAFVEEVRASADIVKLISEHVPLRKMGTSWKGLCPFHGEKTPSFNVRSNPAVFHCFGCGEGGDVFKFVMLKERLSFPQAVEQVARRFGIAVPERTGGDGGPDRQEREAVLAVLEAATDHYQRQLWAAPGKAARDYLLGRGFRKETLEKIRAGAAREGWTDILDLLRPKFAPELLSKAGLIIEREDQKGRVYDRFRNRAVFPILNDGGRAVGFGARSLDGSEPKYLNSPESPVYQKSRTVYGLSWAKEAIRQAGHVVLMEGYLDVARAMECGVGEAVATCGTALTPGHARLLRRFSETVIVNFDQDAAGQKAARKSIDILMEDGLKVRVVELPDGHDPDTYLKAFGGDAYRERLREAPDALSWLIQRAAVENDLKAPAGKAAYLNALLPTLARLPSAVERAAWLTAIAERGGLDPRATQDEARRALASRTPVTPDAPVVAPRRRVAPLPAERLLLARITTGAAGIDEALDALDEEDLTGLQSGGILRTAKKLRQSGSLTAQALAGAVATEEEQRLVREAALTDSPATEQSAMDCVRELRHLALKRRLAEIQTRLEGASGDRLEALLREKVAVTRLIAGL